MKKRINNGSFNVGPSPGVHFFVVMLFLLLAEFSSAQKFSSALLLGISATQVDGDDRSGYHKPGLIAGASVQRKLTEKKALELQLYYIQKGSRHNPNPDKGDFSSLLIRFNYIEMPLLWKYTLKKFTYELGPSFGFLLNSYIENETGTISFRGDLNKTETTVNVGINYNLSRRFQVNWRYSYSLFPVKYFAGKKIYDNLGYYNNVLQFTLRYNFKAAEEKS
jgi:hypothetical protein